ncbi:MAG: patatin-like phospholipase family protein, partial [Clostridia bacterium]|nr:patatin-like phospholipase family protein [Clostridia bacterium]
MARRKKLGLALGSGGSRGVAHIGFLQALDEAGIKPDCISGCSMGSIVGAAYAAGMPPEEMRRAAVSLRFFDLVSVTRRPGGLLDTHSIRRILKRHIGDITFADLKIPYSCVAVDMVTQKVIELSEGSVLDAVIASSSIPAIFKPTEKDGMRLVDGGILERVPVRRVKNLGASKVVAVDVLGKKPTKDKCPNAIVMLTEVVELMDNYR